MGISWVRIAALGAAGGICLILACEDHSRYLTNEPEGYIWGTFGEEVYRLVARSLRGSEPYDRLNALERRRDEVVEAADLMLPTLLYAPARSALSSTLVHIDNGTLPRVTSSTARLIEELASDRPTVDAALTLRDQPWMASRREVYDLLRHLALARSRSDDMILLPLSANALRLVREHDGRDGDGQPNPVEPQELRELFRSLSLDLGEVEQEGDQVAHTFDSSLLERLVAAVGVPMAGDPVWVALADDRGIPLVARDPSTGALYWPFVDNDGDGLADVEPGGAPVIAPTAELPPSVYGHTDRHSQSGQALAYNGRPIYEYVNFNRTGAGVITRALREITIAGDHDELVHHIDMLLSPRGLVVDERDGASYMAFPADRTASLSPLFDLLWAAIEASRDRPPDRLLYGAETLVRDHRGEVRRLLEEALVAADAFDDTNHGELAAHNTLFDDLILEDHPPGALCYGTYDNDFRHTCQEPPGPLGPRLIESGVLRDLIDALDDPAVAGFAPALVSLMTHRDHPVGTSDASLHDDLSSLGESPDNRSVFQRLLHLIHDANGANFSTWVTEVINWRIENMALFFFESYCADGPAMVPSLALFFLDEYFSDSRPSPDEIAHFMVVDHSSEFPIYANPRGREGLALHRYNADTLLALEVTGMNDALRPIVQVFCDHDELLLLANLFSVLHEHYSTLPEYTTEMTAGHDFYEVDRPAGVRTYEAAIARAIDSSQVVDAAIATADAADEVFIDGRPLIDETIQFVDHLIDADTAVMLRAHPDDPSRDVIYRYDRQTPMTHPTHLNVISQRVAESIDEWETEDADVREHLTHIFDLLAEHALDWPGEDALPRDQAEYLLRRAERALPVLGDWSRENLDRGTWDVQIADALLATDDLEEGVTDLSQDPFFPALLDIILLLLDDAETAPLIQELILYFLSPVETGADSQAGLVPPLTALARLLAALVQVVPDRVIIEQLATYLASVLDPITSPVATLPGDLAEITGADESSLLLTMIAKGLAQGVPSAEEHPPPLIVLSDVLATLGRGEPGSEEPLDANDIVELADHAATLLTDTKHGLERIYDIVEARAE